jgi:hypothetical protein
MGIIRFKPQLATSVSSNSIIKPIFTFILILPCALNSPLQLCDEVHFIAAIAS